MDAKRWTVSLVVVSLLVAVPPPTCGQGFVDWLTGGNKKESKSSQANQTTTREKTGFFDRVREYNKQVAVAVAERGNSVSFRQAAP